MAAAKPEVLVSQLLHEILTKLQRLPPHIRGSALHGSISVDRFHQFFVELRYKYFRFGVRHLGFLASVRNKQRCQQLPWKASAHTCWDSSWIFDHMLHTSEATAVFMSYF